MLLVNNMIEMDCLKEAIILGIDVIIFGFCLKSYRNYKNTVGALKVILIWFFFSFVHLLIDYILNIYILFSLFVYKLHQEAPQLNIDKDLGKYVASQKNSKIPYAVLRGTVTPMGSALKSVKSSVGGVLQIIKVQ